MKWSHDRERYCHWSSPCQLEKFRCRSSRCLGLWRYTLAKLTWLWKHNNSTTSWKCISYLKIGDFPASHVRFTGGYFQSKGGMHSWRAAKGVLSGTSRRQWWRGPSGKLTNSNRNHPFLSFCSIHPPKTNIEPENNGLEDDSFLWPGVYSQSSRV